MRSPGFQVFRGADGVAETFGANVVAFGKFDGVHLGHRALLDRATQAAHRLGLPCGAVTFERHPFAHLKRGPVPPALTGLAERLRLLRDGGAQFVVLLATDSTVLGVPAEDFARDHLQERMHTRVVVVGQGFQFGRGGTGGIVTIRRLASVTGLEGVEVGTVEVAGVPVSSSRIRECVACGDLATARDLLGRPYEVLGACASGDGPSAIVLVPAARAVPAPGTYPVTVHLRRPPPGRAFTAYVEVHAPTGRRQVLDVLCSAADLGGAAPCGPARVVFGAGPV